MVLVHAQVGHGNWVCSGFHIHEGSAAMMEPHIKSLTAVVSGYGFVCLSGSRTVERKASYEAMLDLQRVCEQEQGCSLLLALTFLPVPLSPDRTAVCLQAKRPSRLRQAAGDRTEHVSPLWFSSSYFTRPQSD